MVDFATTYQGTNFKLANGAVVIEEIEITLC